MVASFMPSLAFAAGHTHNFADDSAKDGTVTYAELVGALNGTNAKFVKVTKEPTCTEDGEAVFTCIKDDCDEEYYGRTITAKVTKDHTGLVKGKEYNASDLAAQLVAQNTKTANSGWTQAQADSFLKTVKKADRNESYCYYVVDYCADCNKIVGTIPAPVANTGLASTNVKTPTEFAAMSPANITANVITAVKHERQATSGCNTEAPCVKCGEVVAATGTPSGVHVGSGKWVEVSAATCDSPAQEKELCSTCKEPFGVARDVEGSKALGHDFSAAKVTKDEALVTGGTALKKGYFEITGKTDSYGNAISEYYKANAEIEGTVETAGHNSSKCHTVKMGLQCANCGDYVVFKGDHTTDVTGLSVADATTVAGYSYSYAPSTVSTHDYEAEEVAASCGVNAKTVYTCKVCGENYESVKKDTALEHNYKLEVVEADCMTNASFKITCTNKDCPVNVTSLSDASITKTGDEYYFIGVNKELKASDYIKIPDVSAKAGHKLGVRELFKEATCTSPAIWARKCERCGKVNPESITTVGTKAGHKWEKIHTPATCGAYGCNVEKCAVCGNYNNDTEAGTNDATLAKHYDIETEKPLVGLGAKHTGEAWKVTKVATVFEEGVKTLVCPTCGVELGAKTPIAKKSVAKASNTVKAGKKSFTVKATAANATGYRVYYKKAGAKSWKSYTKKTDSLSKTFSGLSKGKYSVKVRAYAKNYAGDGEVVWGATSSTKTVKVK